jgi:hypothetical protein
VDFINEFKDALNLKKINPQNLSSSQNKKQAISELCHVHSQNIKMNRRIMFELKKSSYKKCKNCTAYTILLKIKYFL